jgi:hypothetical protein
VAVSELPPPPPPSGPGPTQIAGQQAMPTTAVPGGPVYAPAQSQTNTMAIVSLVAAFASFFAHIIPVVGGFTVAVVAIVTGIVARGQIRKTGEQGIWLANLGIIIGVFHIVLGMILLLVFLFLIFVLGIAMFGIAAHGGGASPTPAPTG